MNDPYRPNVSVEFPRTNDEKNLHLVSVFHYVVAGLIALGSFAFIAHIVVGVMVMKSDPSSSMGLVFVIMGAVAVVFGWTVAALTLYAGRCIARRRRHQFCLIIAGLSTLWMPFGTLLGVFTLLLLTKPHVRTLFGDSVVQAGEPAKPVVQTESPGWVSAETKRRFTRQAVLIGVGLFVAHTVVVVGYLANVLSKAVRGPHVFQEAAGATLFEGRVWFVESARKEGITSKHLASVGVDDNSAPTPGPAIPGGSRFLAADGSSLWVLGNESLARYEGGQVSTYPTARAPYWSTPPFTYDFRPAVLDWHSSREIRMKLLDGDEWREVPGESWNASDCLPKLPTTWAAVPTTSGLDVFVEFKGEVRWRHLVEGDAIGDPRAWELVDSAQRGTWAAVQLGGESVVIRTVQGFFDQQLQLLHHDGTGWVTTRTVKGAQVRGIFAAIPLQTGALRLISSNGQGLATVDVVGDTARSRHTHAGAPLLPFDARWLTAVMCLAFVPSLLAAAALSWLMRRDRIDALAGGGGQLRFASLLQRGVAYGIDHSFAWVATLPWWWPMLRAPMVQPMSPRDILTPMLAVVVAWVLTLLGVSYTEGRWGTTPGKWLVGIKVVGADLGPCGFRRGLLRNVFRVMDGILSFAVGMFAVAFTRNWQRLGDQVARTLVVRSRTPMRDSTSTAAL